MSVKPAWIYFLVLMLFSMVWYTCLFLCGQLVFGLSSPKSLSEHRLPSSRTVRAVIAVVDGYSLRCSKFVELCGQHLHYLRAKNTFLYIWLQESASSEYVTNIIPFWHLTYHKNLWLAQPPSSHFCMSRCFTFQSRNHCKKIMQLQWDWNWKDGCFQDSRLMQILMSFFEGWIDAIIELLGNITCFNLLVRTCFLS